MRGFHTSSPGDAGARGLAEGAREARRGLGRQLQKRARDERHRAGADLQILR